MVILSEGGRCTGDDRRIESEKKATESGNYRALGEGCIKCHAGSRQPTTSRLANRVLRQCNPDCDQTLAARLRDQKSSAAACAFLPQFSTQRQLGQGRD